MKNVNSEIEFLNLVERVRGFRDVREWDQFHTLKDLSAALAIEAVYPTLGDEDYDDECYDEPVVPASAVAAMHPGYYPCLLLDAVMRMAPDGICLYNCIVAAMDYFGYASLSPFERVAKAEGLRRATMAKLREYGLSKRAARLCLSGVDGYPDE